MSPLVQDRLARVILRGGTFTADTVTGAGLHTADGIGGVLRWADSRGLIEKTGDMVTHRPGGPIHVWQSTSKGRTWASARIDPRGQT